MDICSQAHVYSPGELCCNLLGWQELCKCGCLVQEVALWAAGSTSLTQTLRRKHCSGKRAVFLVRCGRGGCEPCEGIVKNPAVFAVSILLE